jgi:YhcH/YjgK/YiaL family protein
MIYDSLNSETTQWLRQCCPALREAFDWIRALPGAPSQGITELRGKQMYVNVHGYDTLSADQCNWESHRHTMDLQYCISGGEVIEWLPSVKLEPSDAYNAAKDTQKWRGKIVSRTQLSMFPGAYAIFLPNELHRPKVGDGINPNVYKLVVKIHEELLNAEKPCG